MLNLIINLGEIKSKVMMFAKTMKIALKEDLQGQFEGRKAKENIKVDIHTVYNSL